MDSIPVVDFSAFSLLVTDDRLDNAAVQRTADQVINAFETIGFVYLSNTAYPKQLLGEFNDIGRQFFGLSNDTKLSYKIRAADNFGWVASGQESVDESRPGDLKECFNVNLKFIDNESRWPIEVPEFKRLSLEFFNTCVRLTRRVLMAIARGLHLPSDDFFDESHHTDSIPGGSTLRLLFYPPLPTEIKPDQIRLGEHTDYGSITLLFQDDIGGLEVRTVDGKWVEATPIVDTVLVNVGDLLQRWTSDRLISTPHRILLPDDVIKRRSARRSTVFFVHPDPDYVVVPLDGSDKYPPITDRQHLTERLNATYTF